MLGNSGIGLNNTTYRIDAMPEVWEAHLKVDPTACSLKNKAFLTGVKYSAMTVQIGWIHSITVIQ
ncbi:hypothetical protein ACS0TY_013588 [Phlomoides rotata]